MKPISILLMAITMTLLSFTAYAQDYDDCRLNCSGERDTRNMDCPSPYDQLDDERNKCLKQSQEEYENCINKCPAPPPASPSGVEGTPPGSEM